MEIFIHFVAHTSMESASCVTFPEGDSEGLAAGVFDYENPPSERYRKGRLVSYLPLWRPGRPPFFDTEMAERVCSVYHAECYAIGEKGGLRRFHGAGFW